MVEVVGAKISIARFSQKYYFKTITITKIISAHSGWAAGTWDTHHHLSLSLSISLERSIRREEEPSLGCCHVNVAQIKKNEVWEILLVIHRPDCVRLM